MSDQPHDSVAPSDDLRRDGGPREAAQYIKGEVTQLAALARRHHLDLLRYLLDMALQEAHEASHRDPRDPS